MYMIQFNYINSAFKQPSSWRGHFVSHNLILYKYSNSSVISVQPLLQSKMSTSMIISLSQVLKQVKVVWRTEIIWFRHESPPLSPVPHYMWHILFLKTFVIEHTLIRNTNFIHSQTSVDARCFSHQAAINYFYFIFLNKAVLVGYSLYGKRRIGFVKSLVKNGVFWSQKIIHFAIKLLCPLSVPSLIIAP